MSERGVVPISPTLQQILFEQYAGRTCGSRHHRAQDGSTHQCGRGPEAWQELMDRKRANVRAGRGSQDSRWPALLLQVAIVYVPFLQDAFGTTNLGRSDWLFCAAVASLVPWLRE